MESFSGSAFVLVRAKHKMSACLPAYLPTCKSGSLLVFGHLAQGLPLRLSMEVSELGGIFPGVCPENNLNPEAI